MAVVEVGRGQAEAWEEREWDERWVTGRTLLVPDPDPHGVS